NNLYGTTVGEQGKCVTQGTAMVFKVTMNGTFTTLASYAWTNLPRLPERLTLGADGNFYGTAPSPWVGSDYGSVIRLTTNGVLTTLVSFNGTNGAGPGTALVIGSGGSFYGTTSGGGTGYVDSRHAGLGTVFRVTPDGI